MDTTTVRLTVPRPHSVLGPRVVAAQPVTPGLYIFPTSSAENYRPSDQWRLAHHSGLSIGAFPSEEQALAAGEDVVGLADWTLSPEELSADGVVDLDELDARMLWAGGRLLRREVAS